MAGESPQPSPTIGDDTELVWRHYGLTLHEIREANWLLLNDPKAGTTCYRALAAEIRAREAATTR